MIIILKFDFQSYFFCGRYLTLKLAILNFLFGGHRRKTKTLTRKHFISEDRPQGQGFFYYKLVIID